MTIDRSRLTLGITLAWVSQAATNYRLPSWPPPDDFPIIIDREGTVVSRYGEPIWRLWPWAGKALSLNFGDGPLRNGASPISPPNAELLRRVMAWLLYGPHAVREATTLKSQFKYLRPIFVYCSLAGITASDLCRHPLVLGDLAEAIKPSRAAECIGLLHELFEQREELGFVLVDRAGLKQLAASIASHEKSQTPYIPPRIWIYQVNRLREFLDDFTANREQLIGCYKHCLTAYREASVTQPFSVCGALDQYLGPFSDTAQSFGISGLLEKWLLPSGQAIADCKSGIRQLTRYFNMLGFIGTAYLVNFSLMRIEEAWSLRTDCLECENDERFGPIYLLKGPTTKTIKDGDARWVTSPSAKVAVDAMSCIAKLRMTAVSAEPNACITPDDLTNPYLAPRSFEPWCNSRGRDKPLAIRPTAQPYKGVAAMYPNLFDPDQLKMTQDDLDKALLVTPSLDPEKFAVGKVWPLAWHQLRRTGAVNMQSCGLVSDASLQYQLKHATRAMSLYYGNGYSRVRLNQKARNEFVKVMYETLGKQLADMSSSRWVSPHGDKRKDQILQLVSAGDAKELAKAAKQGKVSWRPTLLGACTKLGPCEFGGVTNIIRCGGGDGKPACADAIYDRQKEPQLVALKKILQARRDEAPEGSPYRESLEAQLIALEHALNAIKNK